MTIQTQCIYSLGEKKNDTFLHHAEHYRSICRLLNLRKRTASSVTRITRCPKLGKFYRRTYVGRSFFQSLPFSCDIVTTMHKSKSYYSSGCCNVPPFLFFILFNKWIFLELFNKWVFLEFSISDNIYYIYIHISITNSCLVVFV